MIPFHYDTYRKSFNHFMDYIKIHDLQVLLDYSPKIVESFFIDYVIHLRDVKRAKIHVDTGGYRCNLSLPGNE